MSKDSITKVKGIWSEEEVKRIKSWTSSKDGTKAIKDSIASSRSQSKIIDKMAIVSTKSLKEPFTYIIE